MTERMRQQQNENANMVTVRVHTRELNEPICISHQDGHVERVTYSGRAMDVRSNYSRNHRPVSIFVTDIEFNCRLLYDQQSNSYRIDEFNYIRHEEQAPANAERSTVTLDTEQACDTGRAMEERIAERVLKMIEEKPTKRKHISLG